MKRKLLFIVGATILLSIIVLKEIAPQAFADNELSFFFMNGKDYELFNDVKLAPSRETGFQTYTIRNENEEPIDLKTRFVFSVEKSGQTTEQLEQMLSFYEISGELNFNNKSTLITWISLNDFVKKQPLSNLKSLEPNEIYEFEYSIRLSEKAGNEFQGAKLQGNLNITSNASGESSNPTVTDTDGKELPNTATKTVDFFLFGALLIIAGSLLLTRYFMNHSLIKRGEIR